MFQRILVCNRGEIALRVIRACRDMGIEVVAVYSEADREAPYLNLADEAICIGPAAAAESYLNIPHIISAAEIADVQAIHPGYGFLSENAHFAEVCRSCKIEFIGPPQDAMRRLGNKNEARKVAKEVGVPVVPGSDGLITDEAEAVRLAEEMGYPVLIKASAGGGGRGMRVARNDISLKAGLKAAQQEAEKAFKDGSVYLEKYIEQPRHIEVQISATGTATSSICGNAIVRCSAGIRSWSKNRRPRTCRRTFARRFVRRPSSSSSTSATTVRGRASFCWTRISATTSSRSTPASRSSIR